MSKSSIAPSFIREGIEIIGDLRAQEDIYINCIIKGAVSTSGKLVIGDKGKIMGDVCAANLVVDGIIIGNIEAESVTLNSAALIESTCLYTNNIVISMGARLQIGTIETNHGYVVPSDANILLLDTFV